MLARRATTLFSTLARSPRTAVLASTTVLASALLIANPSIRNNLGSFHSSSLQMASKQYPTHLTEQEWRMKLSPEQFRVRCRLSSPHFLLEGGKKLTSPSPILREKGTEMAGTGEYDKHYPGKGVYECAGCGQPLYTADTKFKSGCGWPAYFDAIPGAVDEHVDRSWGMERIEITCSGCGGHLGHIFKGEGYDTPTDARHCVNSVSIKFDPSKDMKYEGPTKEAKA
ncbi:putative Methionine-R-sulfoxide reductase SelR [Rhodotorula toruloides ATCC 204091]|uniref:Peptide-methionine (R)-S-oxide reductase n=1 Tax=Rhodotorula toruloides TaxID=5286 RepID=A0A0K3C8N3_RHOTO|nr:putative Methionine-R-sulfoxide reductase SelR [Rhodotorula toruloides ATCC 204091]